MLIKGHATQLTRSLGDTIRDFLFLNNFMPMTCTTRHAQKAPILPMVDLVNQPLDDHDIMTATACWDTWEQYSLDHCSNGPIFFPPRAFFGSIHADDEDTWRIDLSFNK